MFRNLREWFIGQFGADTADKVLPGYDVRAIEIGASETIEANRRRNGLPTAFSEADDNTVDPSTKPSDPPQPKESAVTDEEAAQLREQNAALQRQNEELQRAEHERAVEAIRQENTAFAESMAREARIPSAMAGQVAAIGAQLQSTPDVEFGEGDAKKPMHVAFQDLIKALPPSVEFGETATRERAATDRRPCAGASPGCGATGPLRRGVRVHVARCGVADLDPRVDLWVTTGVDEPTGFPVRARWARPRLQ